MIRPLVMIHFMKMRKTFFLYPKGRHSLLALSRIALLQDTLFHLKLFLKSRTLATVCAVISKCFTVHIFIFGKHLVYLINQKYIFFVFPQACLLLAMIKLSTLQLVFQIFQPNIVLSTCSALVFSLPNFQAFYINDTGANLHIVRASWKRSLRRDKIKAKNKVQNKCGKSS